MSMIPRRNALYVIVGSAAGLLLVWPRWLRRRDSPGPADPQPPDQPVNELEQLHRLHNEHRRRLGLDLLRLDPRLSEAARKHAAWMRRTQRLSHRGDGRSSVADRVRSEGYPAAAAGENVARGFTSPGAAMRGWLQSRGHRRNIERPGWTCAGYGRDGVFWCVKFGRRG